MRWQWQGSFFAVGAAFLFGPLAACSTSKSDGAAPHATTDAAVTEAGVDADAAPTPPASVSFPSGFMWGTATAAYQVEKGNDTTDWGHWVDIPGKVANGDQPDDGGADALNHIAADVATMKAAGINAYRFSMELDRIYPTQTDFTNDTPNQAGITAYTTLLQTLQAAGIKPLVTLVHYSLPDWLDDVTQPNSPQGFELATTPAIIATWCGRMAKQFGAYVDWWATLNEPTLPPLGGYVAGEFPPGLVLAADRAATYGKGEALAHVQCYDAIHTNDTVDADGDGKAAQVSLVNNNRAVEPLDPTNPDDVAAAAHMDYIGNLWFWNVAVLGNWDDDFNGDLTGPNDKMGNPSLKGRADYIGLNYYSAMDVSARQGVIIPAPFNAVVLLDHLPTTRPKTDAWEDIYPDGFRLVLDELAPYKLPIIITENGIADASDQNRPRFLLEHAFEVGWGIQRGLNILGYFHWSLLDNFEWNSGFCPKYGLQAVDRTTAARTPRASLTTYSQLIASGTITQAALAAMPPYAAAANPCDSTGP